MYINYVRIRYSNQFKFIVFSSLLCALGVARHNELGSGRDAALYKLTDDDVIVIVIAVIVIIWCGMRRAIETISE